MYVCVCNAITDSQVLRAVGQGVRNLRGLQAHLGIALECGRCAGYALGLIKGETRTNKPQCGGHCGACPRSKEKTS